MGCVSFDAGLWLRVAVGMFWRRRWVLFWSLVVGVGGGRGLGGVWQGGGLGLGVGVLVVLWLRGGRLSCGWRLVLALLGLCLVVLVACMWLYRLRLGGVLLGGFVVFVRGLV